MSFIVWCESGFGVVDSCAYVKQQREERTQVYSRGDCIRYMGQWVRFQTPWGMHQGIVTDINNRGVLMRVPRRYAPTGLASADKVIGVDDEQKLDLALAQWGYRGYGYGPYGGGYGARAGYGGWGYPGYGGWYGGWWWWWLAFAWIFALAFLW